MGPLKEDLAAGSRSTAPAADQRLTVTLIGSLPPIKGVSPYTSHLLRSLADEPGLDIEFIGFRSIYPKRFYPGGDPVDRSLPAPQYPGVTVRNVLSWYNPLSWIWAGMTLKGDVVHAQWWSYILAPVYATVLAIAKLRGKRILLTLHNVDPHEEAWWKKALYRAIFLLGDWFIIHSEASREPLRLVYSRSADVVSVIRHGLLTPISRGDLSPTAARQRLGIPVENKTIICFGNIRPYKGVEDLLRALPEVLAACPSATLVIAGKPWIDWAPVDQLIDELKVRSHVRLFLDFVAEAEVELFFAAADVSVLPYTNFEGQSSVGTLSLFFRKPLIVSQVGGLPDLVSDPRAVVPPANPSALATAITSVLTDDGLRRKLETDIEEIAANLGWEPIAAQTAQLYRSLLPTPKQAEHPEEGATNHSSGR